MGNIYHQWDGTTLVITSDSGTSSCNLQGDKGDMGVRGPQGEPGISGSKRYLHILTVYLAGGSDTCYIELEYPSSEKLTYATLPNDLTPYLKSRILYMIELEYCLYIKNFSKTELALFDMVEAGDFGNYEVYETKQEAIDNMGCAIIAYDVKEI